MKKIKFGKKMKIATIVTAIVAVVSCLFGVGAIKNNNYNSASPETPANVSEATTVMTANDTVIENTITGCNFSGGATYLVISTGTTYTLEDCTFDGASEQAVVVNGGTLNLKNCSITNGNSSTNGVAIYATDGIVNVEDTVITGNTLESGYGAGIYVSGSATLNLIGKTIIADNTISDATSTTNGGSAIYIEGKGSEDGNMATLNIGTEDKPFTGTISANVINNGNGTINAASYTKVNFNSGVVGQNIVTDAEGNDVIYDANIVNGDGEVFYIGATSTLYIANEATLKGMVATESPMIIGGNIFVEGSVLDVQNYIYSVKAK